MDFFKCGIYIQWIIIQALQGNSVICYNMDVPWQHYAKWNKQSQQKQENEWVKLQDREGIEGSCSMGIISALQDEKVLEIYFKII